MPEGPPTKESTVEVSVSGQPLVLFRWGRHDAFGTAAYWPDQARRRPSPDPLRASASLVKEVCFCLLGGFGITAELNHAAFRAISDAGLVRTDPPPTTQELEKVLRQPLDVRGHARPIRYRFPGQRSTRVAAALESLGGSPMPKEPRALRDALLQMPGLGPKTASWVVRNHTGSNEVAIIDVHLRRAGLAAGFFRPEWRLPRDYPLFETAFLAYAGAGDVPAGDLDLCIWEQVRRLGRAVDTVLRPASRVG